MLKKDMILLLGAGGHARSCIDVIESEDRFIIVGLVGLPAEVGSVVLGYSVLGSDEQLPELLQQVTFGLVTVGQIKTPESRIRLYGMLKKHGTPVPVLISPRAHVSRHAQVGAGTIVMHGAIINAGAVVGVNCIINSQALIEHDAVIGRHCHVSTGAVVNSGVQVGDGTFLGSHTTARQGLKIGERCVIGMGQKVLADCESGSSLPPLRNLS